MKKGMFKLMANGIGMLSLVVATSSLSTFSFLSWGEVKVPQSLKDN